MKNKDLLFFIIAFTSYMTEHLRIQCKKPSIYTHSLSFVHHLIATYVYLGSVFYKNYKFHLIFTLLVFSTWVIFGRCPLSITYNSLCNLNPDTKFTDLAHFLFNDIPQYHYILGFVIIIYDLSKWLLV